MSMNSIQALNKLKYLNLLDSVIFTAQYRISNHNVNLVFVRRSKNKKNKICCAKINKININSSISDTDLLFDHVVEIAHRYVKDNFYIVDDFEKNVYKKDYHGMKRLDRETLHSNFLKFSMRDINDEEWNRVFCRVLTWLISDTSTSVHKEDVRFGECDDCDWIDFETEFKLVDAKGLYRIESGVDQPVSYFSAISESNKLILIEFCIEIIMKFGSSDHKIASINTFGCLISSSNLIKLFNNSITDNKLLANLIFNQLQTINPGHSFLLYAKKELLRIDKVESLKNNLFDMSDIEKMNGFEFEQLLILKFIDIGIKAEATPKTKDFGCDIILTTQNETRIAVQCKRFKSKVNLKAVQEVIGALKHYQCDFGIVITNSTYFDSAIQLARNNGIELWDNYSLVDFFSNDLSFSEIKKY